MAPNISSIFIASSNPNINLLYFMLYAIVALIIFGIIYNLIRRIVVALNIKSTNQVTKEKNEDISDKQVIKHTETVNKVAIVNSPLVFIPNVLLIAALIVILSSLLTPWISIFSFQIDLYQIYQLLLQGMTSGSLTLQSLGGSAAPQLSFILLTASLVLYIASVVFITLSFKFNRLIIPTGVINILCSVFFIIGLNYWTSISVNSSSIPLSVVGFGAYLGIVAGAILLADYYIQKMVQMYDNKTNDIGNA